MCHTISFIVWNESQIMQKLNSTCYTLIHISELVIDKFQPIQLTLFMCTRRIQDEYCRIYYNIVTSYILSVL